jgi:hypothetical protein
VVDVELFHVLPHTGASMGRLKMPSSLPGGVTIREASPLDEVVVNETAAWRRQVRQTQQ